MGLAWNRVGLKPARLDRTRVQAGAAELSGSRCPGCCQRLRAGEEPADGDGDRVAEKGGEAGSLQERGAWCGGHSSRRGGVIRTTAVGARVKEVRIGSSRNSKSEKCACREGARC